MTRVRVIRCLLFAAVALLHSYAVAQNLGENDKLLTLWAGTLPVILAAPHGGREAIPGIAPRRGVGVAQFTAERDGNTAELAETVALKLREKFGVTPFLIIARFERKFIDANREPRQPMKRRKPNPITRAITARFANRLRRFDNSGAAACCSIFMPKGRYQRPFSAALITVGALANCKNNLAMLH